MLRWAGKSNRTYQVQRSGDLGLWENAPGGGFSGFGTHSYSDPDAATNSGAYYRVKVTQP